MTSLSRPNTGRLRELLEFFAPTVGLLPVMAFLLYSVKIRIQDKYFESLLIASGRGSGESSSIDVLFLYREDLLLFGVLTPLVIAVIYKFCGRNVSAAVCLTLTSLVSVLLYVELQSWGQVGRFLTLSALVDAIAFALSTPEIALTYISVDGLVKLGCLIGISVGYYASLERLKASGRLYRSFGLIGMAAVGFCLMGAILGFQSQLRKTKIAESFLANAVQSLLPNSEAKNQFNAVSDTQLIKEFHRLSKTTPAAAFTSNFGAERKSNLVLFVLETASIEFLDTRKELPAHRVWNRLSKSRYVSGNHFSTFPASAESNLSILAGLYPPRAYYDTCLTDLVNKGGSLPGPIAQLRRGGIQTAAYLPYESQVPMDKVVFEGTGFQKVFYGSRNLSRAVKSGGAEKESLNEMISDVKAWSATKQQFAIGFFPQYGHGPWGPELGGTIAERGNRVAMQQLDWLDLVVDQLQWAGVLQDTVIIITGDHGVRTTEEDPRVKVGMVDQYSLQVPLIVIAPNSHYPEGISQRPTSHVDVAAELSFLFGRQQEQLMQGLPFLHPEVATRRQFFMSNWYFGADGYREAGESSMHSSVLDVAFSRADETVSFESKHIVVDRSREQSIKAVVTQMLDLQFEWISRFACSQTKRG